MKFATTLKSISSNPREVNAGVPSRIPLGFVISVSPGMVFLLMLMLHLSKTFSATAPFTPVLK